jgi:ribosomal protein S18 acetylase RimI-like enzyme
MVIREFENIYFDDTAILLALFRQYLHSFKDIKSPLDIESAREELNSFIHDPNYPIFVCLEEQEIIGYMILKIDGCVWVEQIYVKENYRRRGVGSAFYKKAETISKGDTLFNYVHPNNDAMISFLKSKGYTVLNLIEIRKPFKGEKNKTTIKVGNNEFDY